MSYEQDPTISPIPKPPKEHHRLRWLVSFGVGILLLFVGVFVWRITYYAGLIRTGEITGNEPAFLSQYTESNQLQSIALPEGDEFQVLTQDDPYFGTPGAKVEIVEFADFGCPYSRQASFTLRSLANRYGADVHYVYRDFPLEEIHPGSQLAAEAGECAQDQDKFWEYHDKVYLAQTDLSKERLLQHAQELRMDVELFATCLFSGKYASEVQQDYQDGITAGVRGTPTFFINGLRIPGNIPEKTLEGLIQRILSE